MTAAPRTAGRQGRQAGTGSMFALVDCKCFYCSCERVFDPALEGVAVAVLSNNDGCVVARSDEVKDAGVRMGEPYFQCKGRLEAAGARVFSSNYALYADMSRRVMNVLRPFAVVQEVYSIDEAFHLLPALAPDVLPDVAHEMRETVQRCTGIPIHVGVGATKTLAKVADELARTSGGVFVFGPTDDDRDDVLARFPVEEVWGIGPARAAKLHALGVRTALDLARVPDDWARRHLTVVGARTAAELRGISCLPLELAPPTRKTIVRSRSFSRPVETRDEMERAVATYVQRVAEKARRFGLAPAALSVFITTRHFGAGPHYERSVSARLPQPTAFTPDLVRHAKELLGRIWRPGFRYKKAGVTLLDLADERPEQANLFVPHDPRKRALMAAVDAVNGLYGTGTVGVAGAAAGMKARTEGWQMHQQRRSPGYTTDWNGLAEARA
ncbi:MAG TPA: Y-family DNA polymerase [Rubricoccaceae bacterium]